ncbi:hypothetical protein GCM10023321_50670 [Pseudonocardia eucalypti]|uniref:Secreted protein n=1 Tax=Pseudonocardia eucalypti TaxID=648755 RepID=A0ABP9QKL8_9PSEU
MAWVAAVLFRPAVASAWVAAFAAPPQPAAWSQLMLLALSEPWSSSPPEEATQSPPLISQLAAPLRACTSVLVCSAVAGATSAPALLSTAGWALVIVVFSVLPSVLVAALPLQPVATSAQRAAASAAGAGASVVSVLALSPASTACQPERPVDSSGLAATVVVVSQPMVVTSQCALLVAEPLSLRRSAAWAWVSSSGTSSRVRAPVESVSQMPLRVAQSAPASVMVA